MERNKSPRINRFTPWLSGSSLHCKENHTENFWETLVFPHLSHQSGGLLIFYPVFDLERMKNKEVVGLRLDSSLLLTS